MTAVISAEAADLSDYRTGLREWLDAHREGMSGYRQVEATSHAELVAIGQRLTGELWSAGWKRWGWPSQVGGYGGGALHRAALYDEISRAGLLTPETDYALEVLGDTTIRFAPDLAARTMPSLLAGHEVWAQGFSETDAGSDLAALRTRAVRDGDHYLVNGQKTWTSNGYLADRIFTLVRTGPPDSRHRGITVLLIDVSSPGVTVRPLAFASGRDELAECFLDEVRVPVDRIIGEENAGWDVAMHLLQYERGMYAWMRQAWLLRRIRELAEATDCADIASAEALGRAYHAVAALRARSATTVARLAAGEPIGPEASADKVLSATAEQTTFDVVRQLLTPEFELGASCRSWRDEWWYTRAASIYGGSAEIQRSILADRVLHLPAEVGRR